MSSTSFIVQLPDELLSRVQNANIDVSQVLVEALEQKLRRDDHPPSAEPVYQEWTPEERAHRKARLDEAIAVSTERLKDPTALRRVPNLAAGTIWIADSFNDPLPDDFWYSGNP